MSFVSWFAMASHVPSQVPRPGYFPPGFHSNHPGTPNSSVDNMQNLQTNDPLGPPLSMLNASDLQPPASYHGPLPVSCSRPESSVFCHAGPPLTRPAQDTVSQNFASERPPGPPFSQPLSFGSRLPSLGVFPSAPMMTGPRAPPSAPMMTGPRVPPLNLNGQSMPPASTPLYGPQMWQMHPEQDASSTINPNQIPHPTQSFSLAATETSQKYQAHTFAPATRDYVIIEIGNYSP
ncbi:hypothetical protein MRB53_007013 [Persea americana]|uniref:Uncharacterized protein n=1 Tax=Persea americana TaxID=3435 RepID=A0ACC2MHT1_PERAE|nr:hypothetical protein MRB53_007013 [Persea americana]